LIYKEISNIIIREYLEEEMKFMENNVKEKKLGAGIITMSIIFIVIYAFLIFVRGAAIMNLDAFNNLLVSQGAPKTTSGQLIFLLMISIFMLVSLILILFKKGIGVYLFAGVQAVSIVYTIITTGLSILTLIGILIDLIPVALLLYFIYRKKDIYFNK